RRRRPAARRHRHDLVGGEIGGRAPRGTPPAPVACPPPPPAPQTPDEKTPAQGEEEGRGIMEVVAPPYATLAPIFLVNRRSGDKRQAAPSPHSAARARAGASSTVIARPRAVKRKINIDRIWLTATPSSESGINRRFA